MFNSDIILIEHQPLGPYTYQTVLCQRVCLQHSKDHQGGRYLHHDKQPCIEKV